ncbi:MAG: glycosyltransferase family 39 protein [Saprospiraceae bacterium]|nr:glycosyltransferase family 39 protein [Saprospiraceae bacterium]
MDNSRLKNILTDFRFWILFFFLIRLIGITNAPLELSHNWRQSLTNMIARNFLEYDANLLYPRIDMAGEKTGIIGSELPFFNYLIYLVSSIFDYSHWSGRLINLIVSSLGLYYFYKLIAKLFNPKVAFNALIVLTVSIWFAFSRKIMPDTFSVALVIIGLYHAYEYLDRGKRWSLLGFFTFCTLGILCKIPALSLFSILAVPIFIKKIPIQRKVVLYLTGTLSFGMVCLWYFYWVPHLVETYKYPLYFPRGLSEGITEILGLIPELLEKFYFSSLTSYLSLVFCIVGLFLYCRKENRLYNLGLAIVSLVFVLFIIKTGEIFPLHNYYVIPFTPVMAVLAGYGIAKVGNKFQYLILLAICVEAIANQQHDFFLRDDQLYKLKLEGLTEQFVSEGELIVINGGRSPQAMYFAHQKGWSVKNEELAQAGYLERLLGLGAKYLILDLSSTDRQYSEYKELYRDEHYVIYDLKK